MIPRDTERTYEGRILDTYQSIGGGTPAVVSGGTVGDDNGFSYSFHTIDSVDRYVQITPIQPFRRVISSSLTDRPQIKSASPGDPCRIDFHNGTVRLLDVLESYLVADCVVPTP